MLNSSEIIDNFISEKKADNNLINLFKTFDQEGLERIEEIIKELSPSANALKNILSIAEEISFREKKKITEVIKDNELAEIISDEKNGRKEKLKKIREYFDALRYPEKNKIQEEIDEIVKAIKDEFGLKVSVPEDLEGDQVKISISGRNDEDFAKSAKKLENFSKSASLRKLFQILKGE